MKNGFSALALLVGLGVSPASAQEPKPAAAKPGESKPAEQAKPADGGAPAVPVAFPTDYRSWKHVKSMVIHSDKNSLFSAFGGIHHIYANEKAIKGLMGGKGEYADGAAFAFDLFESPDAGGAFTEGKRKFVATIVRDAKKYAETKKWGFQAWAEGDKTKPAVKGLADQKACAACHEQVAAKGHVFTEWRP